MIISKTPYRISIAGGSTDYPSFYEKYGSLVLGFTIDKYCYVSVKSMPNFGESHFEAYYSEVEKVQKIKDIKNPGIRGVLQWVDGMVKLDNIAIHVQNELPSRTGVGSSSCLIVGLLKALYTLYEIPHDKRQLANEAIYIERTLLGEPGGIQDQIFASYGGFNSIEIDNSGTFSVKPFPLDEDFIRRLKDRCILFYTNNQRNSFEIAASHDIGVSDDKLGIYSIAHFIKEDLYRENIEEIIYDLRDSWKHKCGISNKIANDEIKSIVGKIEELGGGAKLIGSGGSGFIFAICPDLLVKKKTIKEIGLPVLDFNFSFSGAEVIYKE